MILVDTSVWIDYLNGISNKETDFLNEILTNKKDIPAITSLIITELLQGIRAENQFQEIKNYLLELPFIEPKNIQTYIFAADIYRECRKNGITIRSSIDCLIAAIALEYDCFILHKDRDYAQIAKCFPLKIIIS